ncbi:MAG: DUF1844 domain-containing protein [Myxococcota bacterium]
MSDDETTTQKSEAAALPPMNFSGMVISFGTSALVSLGQVPNPETGTLTPDLVSAKQTIDMLGVIAEKTQGNLTPEEEQLLTKLLFDLRMGYVKASS